MERPDDETIARYEAAVPEDPRAVRGQMFAHPGAFVNGNMFFGTFAQTLVARVGEPRALALAKAGRARIFEPMPGRAWREYVQVARDAVPAKELGALARDALAYAATLPPKGKARASAKAPKAGARDANRAERPSSTTSPSSSTKPAKARAARGAGAAKAQAARGAGAAKAAPSKSKAKAKAKAKMRGVRR